MAIGDTINTGTLTQTFDEEFNTFVSSPDGSTGLWDTSLINGGRTLEGNGEQEYYSDSSVGVNPFSDSSGVLNITATKATSTNALDLPYNSGAITTEDSFNQLYGYFEIDAKLPAGQGLWPAFWLLPSSGAWPPELDVFEVLENDPNTVYFTTHSNDAATNSQALSTVDTSAGYNLYGVMWGPETIQLYINNVEVAEAPTPADMDVPMYMLANLAVGGYWPGDPDNTTTFPATMSINYIHAYAYPGTTGGMVDDTTAAENTGAAATAPVIALTSSAQAAMGAFAPLSGLKVSSNWPGGNFTIQLSASDGLLATPSMADVTTTGEGTANLTLIGNLEQVNQALAALTYERTASGTDWVWVSAVDPEGLSTTSYITVSSAASSTATLSTQPTLTVASAGLKEAVGADSLLTGLGITDAVATDYINLTITAGTGTFTDTADSGATIAGNESNSITFTGTAGALEMELNQLYYQAGAATGTDKLSITATDALGDTATSHVTLSIVAAGSITTTTSSSSGTSISTGTSVSTGTGVSTGTSTSSGGTTTTSATPSVAAPAALTLASGASSAVSGVTVSDSTASGNFTVMVSDSTGKLSVGSKTGVTVAGNASTALTLTGSLAAINADLASLIYQAGTAGSDYLWVSAADASGNQGLNHVVVNVSTASSTTTTTSTPALPVVQTTAGASTAAGSEISLTGTAITESGATGIFSVSVSDTTGMLSVSAASGVTIQGNGTDVLKLTGSLAAINADLASLKYQAGTATGTDYVWVSATDAAGNQGLGHEVVTLTAPVAITPPVVTAPAGATLAAGAAIALSGVKVTDATSTGTFTVTVSDTAGLLSATAVSGVSLTGSGTDDLTLTGSLAAINAELATLKYKAGASTGTDYLWVSATDAAGNQGLSHEVMTVTSSVPVVNNTIDQISMTTGASQKLSGISVADAGSSGTFSVAVSDTLGKLTISSAAGVTVQGEDTNVLHLTGSLAAINADLSNLIYLGGTTAGTDYLWISASDAAGNQGLTHEVLDIGTAITVSSAEVASDITNASTLGFISSGYSLNATSGATSTGIEYSFDSPSQTAASTTNVIGGFHPGVDLVSFVGLGMKLALQGSVASTASLSADSIAYQQSGANMLVYVNETSVAETLAKANLKIQLTGVTGLSASNFLHV